LEHSSRRRSRANFDKRANAIQALGLTFGDSEAVQLAEEALHDKEPTVRAAAAKALGAMSSTKSIPLLRDALSDKTFLFAWRRSFLDPAQGNSGYDLYYDVLMGERKGGKNLIFDQMNDLKTRRGPLNLLLTKASALSLRWIWNGGGSCLEEKKPSPTRAAAARELANDPTRAPAAL